MNVLNLNRIILVGNLIADPKMQTTTSGATVCHFRIAVNRDHLSADGQRIADYINCVAWGNTAEFVKTNFSKGKPVLVIGSLQTGSYKDKDGNKNYYAEISVDKVRMVEAPDVKQNQQADRNMDELYPDDDQNLPF